jgi:nucleoside-diphosphate-sugar epimerase
MRILIPGGGGYVGTVLVSKLLELGHDVTVLDTFKWGVEPILHMVCKPRLSVVKGDVRDTELLRKQIDKADAVINLAALVGFPICKKHPREAEDVILKATSTMVDLMQGTDKLMLNASTGSVYGKIEVPCSESTPLNPQSLYGKLKAEAEKPVLDYGGVSFRFATLFGASPCMRFDLLPNAFVWRAVNKGHLVLYRGNDRRTFLEVHDAVGVYVLALSKYAEMSSQVYNVGDESMNVTKRGLAHAVKELYPSFKIIEEEVGDDPDFRDYDVAYEEIRKVGFKPQCSMSTALAEVGKVARVCDAPAVPWRFELG